MLTSIKELVAFNSSVTGLLVETSIEASEVGTESPPPGPVTGSDSERKRNDLVNYH